MNLFQRNKTKLTIVFFILLGMSFIKCANESQRHSLLPGIQLNQDSPLDETTTPQTTTLTNIINNSSPSQSQVAKEVFIKQTLNHVINKGLNHLQLDVTEHPWNGIEDFFDQMGANPHGAFTIGTRVHVHSTEAVNGLRYLNAGFNVVRDEQNHSAIKEKYLAFEIEKFENNFDVTLDFLKEGFLGEDAEPCLNTMQDHVFFKKDNWIVEVFKETKDSIDLNSVYPPRTLDDIGVVRVSISSGDHDHHLEGSCLPTTHNDDEGHH